MEQPPPLTEEQEQDKKQLAKVAPLLALAAFAFIAISGGLCLSGTVNLAGRTTALANFGERLEFTVKYQSLSVISLLAMIINVIAQRTKTGALNPLLGRDIYIEKQTKILQNTFEQFILSAFSQICLVAFISGEWTLALIPWVNYLFLLGRITFMLGYPGKRTFGMVLGFAPSVGMICVMIYKFFVHQFISN